MSTTVCNSGEQECAAEEAAQAERALAPGEEGVAEEGCDGGGKGGKWVRILLMALVAGIFTYAGVLLVSNMLEPAVEYDMPSEPLADGVVLDCFTLGLDSERAAHMEAWAREVVETEFATALKEGRLMMRTQEGDVADIHKYGIDAETFVLREVRDGMEMAWQILIRAWELSGDEGAFKAYIAEQLRSVL